MKAADPILVLGHRGLVGQALARACGEDCLTPPGGHDSFDLARPATIGRLIDDLRPRGVINCAAFTNVDACESQPELAMAVNAEGPGVLAQACRQAGAHLIHLSTDYVFGNGHKRPLTEADQPAPLSVYGQTKLEGERRVLAAGGQALVVRIAWVFGPDKPTLVDKMIGWAREGRALKVVNDQVGSPTYTLDLAPALLELAERRVSGLLHVVNQGLTSRYEFIRRALGLAGLDPERVSPVTSDQMPTPAARPEFSALDTRRFMRVYPGGLPTWTNALARHLGADTEAC